MQRPSPAGPSLWDFALAFYACGGVADACLRLQDEHGVDVNMLMFAAWAGHVRHVSLSSDDADRVLAASRTWQEQVVSPVRELRRRLKKAGPAGDAHAAGVIEAVKAVELQAERAELDKAESLAASLFAGRHPERDSSVATGSIACMLGASGVPEAAARDALALFERALHSLHDPDGSSRMTSAHADPLHPSRRWLTVEPLEAHAFSPFGDVIEAGEQSHRKTINEGFAERYDDLARLDLAREGGRPVLSIFRARPRVLPFQLRLVERHRAGSQAFVPLQGQRFLVVVAAAGAAPSVEQLRCFMTKPGQGVNYAAGTWHHPLIALDDGGDFLVIDRAADATDDCEEHSLVEKDVWVAQ